VGLRRRLAISDPKSESALLLSRERKDLTCEPCEQCYYGGAGKRNKHLSHAASPWIRIILLVDKSHDALTVMPEPKPQHD
jgi:hypothetical protein